MDTNSSLGNRITAILISLLIIIISVALVLMPKKAFSDNENRELAPFPEFSASAVKSGNYMEELNTYATDHFPMRDMWIGIASQKDILLGKHKINGIYIAGNNYLIGEYEPLQNTDRIIQSFNKFKDSISDYEVNTYLMLVPTSFTINAKLLPNYITGGNQLQDIKAVIKGTGLPYVDAGELLAKHTDEYIFYRTDHHWTTLGAYYGYEAYCRATGLEATPLNEYKVVATVPDFYGTYASKVNAAFIKPDTISLYAHPDDCPVVTYDDTGVVTDTLYNMDYAGRKDKYSILLDNLHTLITIENENATTDRVLLIVKDSYANSIIPYLTHNYKTIYVVDTRYYRMGPSYLVKTYPDITDVLILYNMSTIDSDTGIRGIF